MWEGAREEGRRRGGEKCDRRGERGRKAARGGSKEEVIRAER